MAVTTGGPRIRDLDEAAFAERFDCDRFTATVLANRFGYVVEHMCSQLLTTAFSPILRDFYDFAATVTGPPSAGYATPAVSNSIILFTGTMTESVRISIEEYGVDRLEPGDVIIANDPYRTGTHVNDLLFIRPIFAGGDIVAFVTLKAHHLDMGGSVPGGFSTQKHNLYEDGLVISPRPLYKAGKPVQETWTLVFDNSRFGDLQYPDMQTICSNLDLGERLLQETIERYGVQSVLGAMTYVCDAGAERMTEALAAIPDGTWEGSAVMDADGAADDEEYRITVRITKAGERAEVDFSGSSRQARTSVNGTFLDAKSVVGVAFKYLLDPRGTYTSGLMRPIDIVLPEGTIISAMPPDGPVFLYFEASQIAHAALLRALGQAVGERAIGGDAGSSNLHNAAGLHPNGMPWQSAGQAGGEQGPWGGTREGDGDTFNLTYQANGIATPVEAAEFDAPVVILQREILPDTAGPGTHRGGSAVVTDSLWRGPAAHYPISLRHREPSGNGVNGGREGTTGGVWFWIPPTEGDERGFTGRKPVTADAYADSLPVVGRLDPETNAPSRDGQYVWFGRRPVWQTPPNTMLRYINNGGGGWGDPMARDPEAVKRDVRDGFVTVEGAARDYGVVVTGDPERDPEGLAVDAEATARLRGR
jgi:N-methylhydantoinase B